MLKLFRVFGRNKEETKERKFTEGDKSRGLCPHCSTVVDTTWTNREVEMAGFNTVILASICDHCNTLISCEDAQIEKYLKESINKNSQEMFGSVRGFNKAPESEDTSTIPVVIDNDIEAKNAFMEAFGEDVLSGVGKGNVNIVNSTGELIDNKNPISSLLSDDVESFHNLLRKKEKTACKVWVNWLKYDIDSVIPCNEIVSLSDDWVFDGTNELVIHELEEKLVSLSGTDKIAILMIQKIKK